MISDFIVYNSSFTQKKDEQTDIFGGDANWSRSMHKHICLTWHFNSIVSEKGRVRLESWFDFSMGWMSAGNRYWIQMFLYIVCERGFRNIRVFFGVSRITWNVCQVTVEFEFAPKNFRGKIQISYILVEWKVIMWRKCVPKIWAAKN